MWKHIGSVAGSSPAYSTKTAISAYGANNMWIQAGVDVGISKYFCILNLRARGVHLW